MVAELMFGRLIATAIAPAGHLPNGMPLLATVVVETKPRVTTKFLPFQLKPTIKTKTSTQHENHRYRVNVH